MILMTEEELREPEPIPQCISCPSMNIKVIGYIFLLGFSLAFSTSVLGLYNENSVTVVSSDKQSCYTKECVASTKYLKKNMDTSVNPCENFYQFACGGFMKNTEIPPEAVSYTHLTLPTKA